MSNAPLPAAASTTAAAAVLRSPFSVLTFSPPFLIGVELGRTKDNSGMVWNTVFMEDIGGDAWNNALNPRDRGPELLRTPNCSLPS
ncbi:hypothetical protein BS47DRAFT_1392208 [Hydnum rufescens UP504]|uniref:Uncharacterized protein n=1 Tax=Hydnum rufescens UP504 TaxID=1448309 RepID=A0A9P6DYC6_9AGAM|nr:hypothetical protein BS47DRAFT_1392208 [Hydnum rufescens UP504]